MRKGLDYIGVNCAFICHDGQGNILMHKRSKNCRDEHGRWDCGAGSMEFGETFEETVHREVVEEYGAKPLEIKFIATKNFLREHNGETTHWLCNLHFVQVDRTQVHIAEPHKVDELGWFTLDNLPEPLHSAAPWGFEMLRKHLNL